jgi:hypothetical protein
MKIHQRYRYLLIAFFILVGYALGIFIVFYPGTTGLGAFFNLAVLLIFTYYIALSAGVILLLFRLFKWIKNKYSLIYILLGILNLGLAFIGIILYFLSKADMSWLHKSIGNLFVGFIIFSDVFLLPSTKN